MKEDLLELKKEINEATKKVAELQGKQTYLLEQLKTEFNCETIEKADVELEKKEKAITKLTDKLNKAIEQLKETYDFNL